MNKGLIKKYYSRPQLRKVVTFLPFLFSLIFFTFFITYRSQAISLTFDETMDNDITTCYTQNRDPFSCDDDISQTRLPYYLHAVMRLVFSWLPPTTVDHGISVFFALAGFILIFWFVNKEFNRSIANLTVMGIATSLPLIVSARMILTHSNIIFVFFTAAAFITFYYFIQKQKIKHLILAAFLYGLSVASSFIGVINFFFFLIFYLLDDKNKKKWWYYLILFVLISVLTFFIFSIIYTQPLPLKMLLKETQFQKTYFNYWQTSSYQSPAYFALLILAIKISPWLLLLFLYSLRYLTWQLAINDFKKQDYFLLSIFIFICSYLLIKPAFFGYEAPHHQLSFYYFIYLLIAYTIYRLWLGRKKIIGKTILALILITFLALQIYWLIIFFPNLLFYGAQYSYRAIGEIYGPAVVLCQDFEPTKIKIEKLTNAGHNVLALNSLCLVRSDLPQKPILINQAINKTPYEYFYTDTLVLNHYQLPTQLESDSDYLKNNCQKYYSYSFPTDKEVYFIYYCPKLK